ncbi:ATP-binding protein [Halorubrum tibetense]|uniref:histidine kinase n=1 Tax=Halorubrum tibetense TaxID=175631 RepID=A0ABD5S9S4_9EURY
MDNDAGDGQRSGPPPRTESGADTGAFERGVLRSSPEATIAIDDAGTVRYANPATERLLGYNPGSLVGEPATMLVPSRFHTDRSDGIRSYLGPDGEGLGPETRAEAHDEGDSASDVDTDDRDRGPAKTTPSFGGAEVSLVHADGDEVPALVSVHEGEIGGQTVLVCVCRRPPHRRSTEHRLRERKREIESLHEVATDMGTCSTPEEVYDTVIRAVERILQFDFAIVDAAVDGTLVPRAVSSNLDGEGYYEETPIDAEDSVAAEVYRTGETNVVDDVREHSAAPADSEFRSVLTVPIGDAGMFQSASKSIGAFDEHDRRAVELLVAHARARLAQLDTEQELRRRTRELERQNDRLEEFASVVSHDLRNPLNVAQGRLGIARQECAAAGEVGTAVDEHLGIVGSAHERMEELIGDILALAKQGATDIAAESVPLNEVATETWTIVDTGDATLRVDADRTVRADRNRLRQLLENLFRNSVEHGSADSRGGSGVTVWVGGLTDGFYVADDGPGIPDDEHDAVFETGFTTQPDGTGFGLAIVEGIVDAHDWDVSVTESESGGVRFEFRTGE